MMMAVGLCACACVCGMNCEVCGFSMRAVVEGVLCRMMGVDPIGDVVLCYVVAGRECALGWWNRMSLVDADKLNNAQQEVSGGCQDGIRFMCVWYSFVSVHNLKL